MYLKIKKTKKGGGGGGEGGACIGNREFLFFSTVLILLNASGTLYLIKGGVISSLKYSKSATTKIPVKLY